MKIKIYSEIGKLRKVLLHRPGTEVERVYPEIFERILFDDIMWLDQARKDHDVFASQLRENGVEVYYIEKLVGEIFDKNPKLKKEFLTTFLIQGGIKNQAVMKAAFDFFYAIKDNWKFASALIGGIKKNEISPKWDETIDSYVLQHDAYPFYLDPIPNILFQRDPIASIFDGMNIHNMTKETRKREGLFYVYLLKYHPEFKDTVKPHLNIDHAGHMEGGDVLVISKSTIFVGVSERTTAVAVEQLANVLFKKHTHLKRIIGIEIPSSHATMHLDTVMTQMDVDKFSVDSDMYDVPCFIYEIHKTNNGIKIEASKKLIIEVLRKYVNPKVKLIQVANGDPVFGKAEQWNDGANCLTLKPGTIFVYDRNVRTNAAVEAAGIKLIKVPSGELGRGRGGPRCMSMPLERDDV